MNKGQRIRKVREDMGISQTELASRIGVSKQNLYKYENSIITNIPSDKIEAIAKICNVSPEYIMGWSIATSSTSSELDIGLTRFGEKIKNLRISLGLTQEDLAIAAGTTKQTIHKYETGIITNIPASKVKLLADKLNSTPEFLMGWQEKSQDIQKDDLEKYGLRPIKLKKFPMLGEIACGKPIYANEDYETYIEASSDIRADFCLTAKGDSMINARIFDGDIIFIRRQPDVDNGEIAAVCIGDEVTLKRVYKYPNRLELRPENPMHDVQNYEGEELNTIFILGKAVAFQSYVR